jgi:hypothetical protein
MISISPWASHTMSGNITNIRRMQSSQRSSVILKAELDELDESLREVCDFVLYPLTCG